MAEISKANILGIIGLLGAILMIIGVFVSWADISASTVIGGSIQKSYSGWTIFSGEDFSDFAYNYVPLVALIAGIVAFVTTILPIILHKPMVNRILGIISLILAIVTIILVVLFNGDIAEYQIDILVASAKMTTGIGAWLSLAGAAILAIGGIIDIANKYKTE